jgi:long-chain acyl-CoA synthetase
MAIWQGASLWQNACGKNRNIVKKPDGGSAYEGLPASIYMTLRYTAMRFPDKTALQEEDGRAVCYSELLGRVDACAAALTALCGVRAGEMVAVMLYNSIEFAVLIYAVMKAGAIAVPVSTKFNIVEIEHILNDTNVRILAVHSALLSKFEGLSARNTSVEFLLTEFYPGIAPEQPKIFLFDALFTFKNGLLMDDAVSDPSQPAMIVYTSGTTGKSKGTLLSHFNILQGMRSFEDCLEFGPDERTVIATPMFHGTGLFCLLLLFVYIGGSALIMHRFDAKRVWQYMQSFRITHFHAVPAVFIMMLEYADSAGPLTAWQSAVCGGGYIPHEIILKYKKKFPSLNFLPVYGLTETSSSGTFFPDDYSKCDKPSSAGMPSPVLEMAIMQDGEILGTGSTGEICIRGANVTAGYWNREINTAVPFPDGWLHTGDVGAFDADGYLTVLDRVKDMINCGGEKIYSLEVENLILTCRGVKAAVLVGLPDPIYGEIPAAAIICEPGMAVTQDDIVAGLRGKIANFKLPKRVEILDEFPATPSGKIQKNKLREILIRSNIT